MSHYITRWCPIHDEWSDDVNNPEEFCPDCVKEGRYKTREMLERENEALRKGLDAVVALINESHGVSGLHLNGDIAPWGELRTGGSFDEWLSDFDAAIKEQSHG